MSQIIIWSRDHPLTVLVAFVFVSCFFAYHVPSIALDDSTKAMMIAADPARVAYDEAIDVFGSDNLTVVYIKDPHLFTYATLTAIEEVFYALQDIPGVLRVDALFNATHLKGDDGTLTIAPFLDWIPTAPSALAHIKMEALRNPLLNKSLISPHGDGIALTITVDPNPTEADFAVRVANDVDTVIATLRGQVEEVFQVGVPFTRRFLRETIQTDLLTVGPLFFALLCIVLLLTLRTWNGVLLPLLTSG